MAGGAQAQAAFELKAVDNVSKSVRNAAKQLEKFSKELDRIKKVAEAASSSQKKFDQAQANAAQSASKAAAATSKSAKAQDEVAASAKKGASGLAALGKSAQRVFFIYETGIRILNAVNRLLVAPFKEAASAAAAFSLKLTEINTLFDKGVKDSAERVAILGRNVEDLAMTYGQDLLKMGSAAYNAVSAGAVDAASAQVVLTNATRLATAGLVETDVAMKALTTVSNAFGRRLTTTEHVADLLFTTVQKGVTTMGELAPKIGRVAGLAGAAGMNMEAMFAIIAAGTKVTGLTSVTVTGLRSAINLLLKPGKEARDTLAGVNERLKTNKIAFGAAATEGDGMIRTLRNMAKAFHEGSLSAEELNRIIPNARAQAVVLGIVKEGAKDLTKNYELMSDKLLVSGVVMEKANLIMREASKQQSRFNSTLAVTRKELGKMFTESGAMGGFFRGLSDGFEDIALAFRITNSSMNDQENTWENLGKVIAKIAGSIISIAKFVVAQIMATVNAFSKLTTVWRVGFADMLDVALRFGKLFVDGMKLSLGRSSKPGSIMRRLLGLDDEGLDALQKDIRKQTDGLNEAATRGFRKLGQNIKAVFTDGMAGLLKPGADLMTELGIILGMPVEVHKIENKFSEVFGATGKGKKKKKPPTLPGDVETTAKQLKEMSAIFAEALAGTQTEFQKAVTRQSLSLFRDVMATGVSGAITQGTDALLSQQDELKNLKFMIGATDPLPEVPVKDLTAKAATMQQVFERMKAGDKEFKTDSQLLEFLKETQAFAGTAEDKLKRFVELIQKISQADIGTVVTAGLKGAQEILQKNVAATLDAEKNIEKGKAEIAKRNLERRAAQDKRDAKRIEKFNKDKAKQEKKAAKQRQKEVENIISQYGMFASQTINQFGMDLFDSTKTVGEAFVGLFDSVLDMISNTLTEFLIAEAIKQAMLKTTADVAVASNATKQASDTVTAVSGVKKAGALTGANLVASESKLGPLGLITLAILIPLFMGMIRGFLADAVSAEGKHRGGLVTNYLAAGGLVRMQPRGTDTVPAMLTPGEFVLSKPIVDSIRQGRSPNSGHYANGGMVAAGGGVSAAAPITVNMQTFAVPSKGEFRRWYKKSVAPERNKLRRLGQI